MTNNETAPITSEEKHKKAVQAVARRWRRAKHKARMARLRS